MHVSMQSQVTVAKEKRQALGQERDNPMGHAQSQNSKKSNNIKFKLWFPGNFEGVAIKVCIQNEFQLDQ